MSARHLGTVVLNATHIFFTSNEAGAEDWCFPIDHVVRMSVKSGKAVFGQPPKQSLVLVFREVEVRSRPNFLFAGVQKTITARRRHQPLAAPASCSKRYGRASQSKQMTSQTRRIGQGETLTRVGPRPETQKTLSARTGIHGVLRALMASMQRASVMASCTLYGPSLQGVEITKAWGRPCFVAEGGHLTACRTLRCTCTAPCRSSSCSRLT